MNSNKRLSIMFTGGGTAGHVHPALEIINQVWKHDRSIAVAWIGSLRGMERRIVSQAFGNKVRFYPIPCGKLRRYFSIRNFFDCFRILAGIIQAILILIRQSPALVFSKGGYVSVPAVIAARLLRIPVISHESDITPGLATRINARFSVHVCLPHARGFDFLSPSVRHKARVEGTPIRQQILAGSERRGWDFIRRCFADRDGASVVDVSGGSIRKPVLLFVGGSLGARQINYIVAQIGAQLIETHDCIIVHQTGGQDGVQSRALSREYDRGRYLPLSYIADEMGDLLALATVVVSRAGANMLWECAALKKAMVLIPLSRGASRGDQIVNAMLFRSHNAALVASEASEVSEAVGTLLANKKKRIELGRCANELTIPGASANLAQLILRTIPSAAPPDVHSG